MTFGLGSPPTPLLSRLRIDETTLRSDIAGGRDTEATGKRSGQIAENVGVQIRGDEGVERRGTVDHAGWDIAIAHSNTEADGAVVLEQRLSASCSTRPADRRMPAGGPSR